MKKTLRIEEFRRRVMIPLALLLARKKDEFAQLSPERFGRAVGIIGAKALDKAFQMAGASELGEFEDEAQANLFFYICMDLNAALPLDYPYAVVVLDFKEEQSFSFFAMERSEIPGRHEMTSRNVCFCKKYDNIRAFVEGFPAELYIKYEDDLQMPPDPTL